MMKKYLLSIIIVCVLDTFYAQIPGVNNQFELSLSYGMNQNYFEPINSPYTQFKNNWNGQSAFEFAYVRRIHKDFFFQVGLQFGVHVFIVKPIFETSLLGKESEKKQNAVLNSPIFNPKIGFKKVFPESNVAIGLGLGAGIVPLDFYYFGNFWFSEYNINDEKVSHSLVLDDITKLFIPFACVAFEYHYPLLSKNRLLFRFVIDRSFQPRRTGKYYNSYDNNLGNFHSNHFVFSLGVGFFISTQGSRDKIPD